MTYQIYEFIRFVQNLLFEVCVFVIGSFPLFLALLLCSKKSMIVPGSIFKVPWYYSGKNCAFLEDMS